MNLPIIRTSERRAFKRCPQMWYWAWRCGLVPFGQIAPALWFGTGVHIALAKWYCGPGLKRGPFPSETFDAWADGEIRYIKTSERYKKIAGADAVIEEKLIPGRELGRVLLDAYLEEYGNDDSWWVIEPERSGQVDIMDPTVAAGEKEQQLAIYGFTYDLVYRDLEDEFVKLGEHKTAATIVTAHLPLDDQAGSYWLVAQPHLRNEGLIGPKETLHGITYNFLRKAMPDTRPIGPTGHRHNKPIKEHYITALQDVVAGHSAPTLGKLKLESLAEIARGYGIEVLGEVSKQQPSPLFHREHVNRTNHERRTQYRRIQDEALLMSYYRDGTLPITKSTSMDCRFCQYFDMCILDEGKADADEYRKSMYQVRDPYADHRKSTEE